jgi:CRP-like cAMP-binding protein
MSYRTFLRFAQSFCPMQPAEAAALFAPFRPVPHRRREHVQQAGELIEDVFFLESGILRGYYLRPDGAEVTTSFFFGPTLVGDVVGLRDGQPTLFNLQVLEAGTLWRGRLADLDALALHYPVVARFFWKFFEHISRFHHQQRLEFIYNSPTERYVNLLRERPQVIRHVAQRHIASYLGLQPESLSRIRQRLARDGFPNPSQ